MLAETAHLFGVLGIIFELNGLHLKLNHHSMIAVSADTKNATTVIAATVRKFFFILVSSKFSLRPTTYLKTYQKL